MSGITIPKEFPDTMKEQVKDYMPEWIATMKRYGHSACDGMGEVWA